MLTVRRLYILAAAFIGLLIFMQSSSELLRLALLIVPQDPDFGLGSDWWRDRLSLNLALLVSGYSALAGALGVGTTPRA